MIYWTIQWIIISLILIILIHYLYYFFKTTLTVPKIRDLIHKPTERYNEMFNIIPSEKSENEKPNKEEMQLELQNFLQEIKQSDSINTLSDNIAFSNY